MMKRLFATLLLVTLSAFCCAAPVVQLITSVGTIEVTLDPERAPKTVQNFLAYVKSGYYDGTIFHRVIPNFVVQGGGYTADMTAKPTREPIKNEADNGLKNRIGTIAMARADGPDTATGQFYINIANNTRLDHSTKTALGWGYTVFGQVTRGMDVVYHIASLAAGSKNGVPDSSPQPIVIRQAILQP